MRSSTPALVAAFAALSCAATAAMAHHTYSMFDSSRHDTLSGTLAKFEWRNPHTYIWMYVPSKDSPGKYDLWSFENGAPSVLSKMGWSKESLQASMKVTVEFSPLRDGKPGGHCRTVTFSDGKTLTCPGPGNPPPIGAQP
jgi:hypothetical protein